MTGKKYPRGWNEARIRRVLKHYEAQTDEESAAEITTGLERTTMEVPKALVPVVRELIAKRESSRARATRIRKHRGAANKSRAA